MKKIIIIFIAVLTYNFATAGPLKIIFGNWEEIVKENVFAFVEFDYSQTMWEEDEPYDKFCGDSYTERVNFSIADFRATFNENSKSLRMTNRPEEAKYKLVFHIKNLERKQGMMMWGRCYIRVYGQIDIIDISTNETICSISVNGLAGDEDYVPNDRLSKCFKKLGEELEDL